MKNAKQQEIGRVVKETCTPDEILMTIMEMLEASCSPHGSSSGGKTGPGCSNLKQSGEKTKRGGKRSKGCRKSDGEPAKKEVDAAEQGTGGGECWIAGNKERAKKTQSLRVRSDVHGKLETVS